MALDLLVNKFSTGARPTATGINFQRVLPFLQSTEFSKVDVPRRHEGFARFFYCGRRWGDFNDNGSWVSYLVEPLEVPFGASLAVYFLR